MVMVNSSSGGANDAVCVNKTPPFGVPVAYDNNAQRTQAIPNVSNILTGGAPTHNLATLIPVTRGDAPGSMGGVVSGTVCSTSRNINGANTVLLHGMPTTRMTDPTQQNANNAIGTGTSPSQTHILNLAP
ncbi:DUF4150 domain-containing protein [Paraburkholderia phenazinium]|jgi:hypothetical protein|uniref:Uncharacterized protein n=1 Tax=Paraburkholderia phenazinium TaxID=60549 RepID=A0A1N6LJ30_9BURK|nr:DUF4150 domain-containing protein [Paraburkholderia phenazinium]SIO68661.1 protein of unknown function [Paraburkholderia phenazinium]